MATPAQISHLLEKLENQPTGEQLPVLYSPKRINLVAGGERAGKSYLGALYYLTRFHESPLVWIVAADYERTRPEFNYIYEGLRKLGLNVAATKRIDPGRISVEGIGEIVTKSANDPRTLAAFPPDGIIAAEASQLDQETIMRLRFRVAEKRGWLLMEGTFEGSLGIYPELYSRWSVPNDEEAAAFSIPSWSNTYVYPKGHDDPEIQRLKAISSEEWFLERIAGKPSPPRGIVFPEFKMNIHVGDYKFDKRYPVYIGVDPGYQHAHVVEAVQHIDGEIYVVDEVYKKGLITSEMVTICSQKPWWKNVVGGAIDVAGRQHQAMPAPVEAWAKEGKVYLGSEKIEILEGIERLKSFLKVSPLTGSSPLHIDKHCTGLISELGGCTNPLTGLIQIYSWSTLRDGTVDSTTPKDRYNDAVKSIIYLLVHLVGTTPRTYGKRRIRRFG